MAGFGAIIGAAPGGARATSRLEPARRLFTLVGALFVCAAAPAFLGARAEKLYAAAVAVLACVAGVDAVRCARASDLVAEARLPVELFVGGDATAEVALAAGGAPRAVAFETFVETEAGVETHPPVEGRLLPGESATLKFPLRALARGPARPLVLWFRWESPWRLWRRVVARPLGDLPAVAQDVRPVREAARRAGATLGAPVGLRPRLTPGEGSDFDALREFAPGHDRRALHWKASARHQKLLVRDFRAEAARHVVLAFDAGRLMTETLDGVARFDHAVRAGLLLAYDASRAGDLVGAFAFGATPGEFLAPAAGAAAFRAVRTYTAGLAPRSEETNFTASLATLATKLKRRTLVVVFTDFADATTAELMIDHLGALARRHLVLFVALKDARLAATASAVPETEFDAARAATAYEFVRERAQVLARLRRLGIDVLDASPEQATAGLVERYLHWKRRERL